MSIVSININSKKFELACGDGSESELKLLVNKLEKRIEDVKAANPTASFDLVLVIASLTLQEELESAKKKIDRLGAERPDYDDEKFAETLTTIAGYLENLAKKLSKT